jgi:hypothetical protein
MEHQITLEYWLDDGRYVGKLKEVPGVYSQGESPEELEENIRDETDDGGARHDETPRDRNQESRARLT